MPTGTVCLHRLHRNKLEKLCRAFLQPHAMAKGMPLYGFICERQATFLEGLME